MSRSLLALPWIHFILCVSMVTCNFYGENYYNDRYGAQGIAYTSDDRSNGLWSDMGSLQSNYLLADSLWSGDACSGCTCNGDVIDSCTGSVVTLRGQSMVNITAGTFSKDTTSITIINCPNFELFENATFENLTSLQEIIVQGTALNHVPDLSTTVVTKVNLAGNQISLSTDNHRGWRWPTTIEYLAMMDNLLYWLPDNFIDGPNLRIASFGNNQLLQIHPTIFGDTSSLIYLGMDGNKITRLSRNSIAALATNNFQHLNISNNEIVFIQAGTFDQLPNIKILEVHNNLLPTINVNIFSNMPELLHLDLHANDISALPRRSFENLPKLMELRLHSQKTKMTSIAYDAWRNIGNELINLFVSENNLQTYPHQVLEEGYYPKLERIYADNNAISNVTEYGSEAFPSSQKFLYSQKRLQFTPFAAYPALHTLYLHGNWITHIENDDMCNMTNLQNLWLNSNLLTEDNIDDDAFQCLPVLDFLNIGSNLIQYVPNAVKSSTVLPALTQLYMQANHLTFLETGTFTNLTTLLTLILTSNKIIAVENEVFNLQIETIKLDSNEFRFTHQFPFSNLQNLRVLWLSSNVINYIPPLAFTNCTSLTEIQMAFNNIPQLLKSHFTNCPLSGDILFNDNDIGYIEDGTFDHVTSMTRFTVANNVLTKLPNGGDFADLVIIDAGDTLQGTMDFTNNRLVYLETHTFVNLVVADYLSLANNKITTIATEAFNGLTAKYLDLRGNSLRELHKKSFTSVSLSESMYINDMFFDKIPTMALYDVSARNIDISNGGITMVENEAFYNVVVSEDLYIENNQLSQIPDGSMTGHTNLQQLYLTNNQINYIQSGLFTDLTALTHLGLASNVIDSVDTNIFNTLGSLEYIYMQNNQLNHFPALGTQAMKVIDLSSNELETVATDAFTNLASLSSLILTDNPLACQCQLVSALHDVAGSITGGSCEYTAAANGLTFDKSMVKDPTYYFSSANNNASVFQCSADNVVATANSGTEIEVAWDQPPYVYFQPNGTIGSSPALSGAVEYQVTCVSNTASTLYDTESDGDATAGSGSFSLTFNTGVVPGTTYECSIKMDQSSYTSAKSMPAVVITPDAVVPGPGAGANDVELDVKYYDFEKSHTDFNDLAYPTISSPTYVASPYGAWLSISNNPAGDTFSTWYRDDHPVNREISDTIILVAQTGTIKKFWSDAFFPVDGQGFAAEQQRDCNGTYHNFGFTTAVRTGIKFAGTEKITLGGGEALWLYINGIKLIDYVSTGASIKECFYVDLSPALTVGGGVIVPQQGSISGGSCTGLSAMSTSATMELELNEIYHFDLFLAETRKCTSELLFQVEDTTFSLDPSTELPIDYSVTISEDFYVDDILTTIYLTDVFSVGPYDITLYAGNENRLFEFKEDIVANQFTTPAPVAPNYTTMVDIDGNTVNFVECTSVFTPTWTTNAASETFSISTSTALFTLKDVLDYETTKAYYFLLTVDDTGKSLTGSIAIRVKIEDVNDNCPILTPTSASMTPLPVLVDAPLMSFASSDTDSGDNSDIRYIVSAVTPDPPVDYNDTMELWDDVYLNYTTLQFEVIAIDNGTVPRGDRASVNVTVSNTCVMDVLFGDITYIFAVNKTTGGLTLRIPKYYVVEFLCSDNIGLSTGIVLDNMMFASSSYNNMLTGPGRARVNDTANTYSGLSGGWVAGVLDTNQYIEVDMSLAYKFTKVHIQGREDADEWVTSFKIFSYNEDTATWDEYTHSNGQNIFVGVADRDTITQVSLDPAVLSSKIRINPQTWSGGNISLRLELSGCEQAEQLYYDVSCVRCETTNYCEGEGIQKPCGRCDPYDPTSTCGRNPVEHSFGHASECTTCPVGWICKDDGYATICPEFQYAVCNSTWCPDSCTQCEAGYACLDGRRTECRPGYFSDGFVEHCSACVSGTYQNESASSSCNPCPAGYYSGTGQSACEICEPEEYALNDGTGCIACANAVECPCMTWDKCFNGTGCYNTGGGTYQCVPCPDGYEANGSTCSDIDECADHNPCFNSRCINTQPGFQCLECPEGYSGTFEDAYSWGVQQRVFVWQNVMHDNTSYQTCNDIDECAINNGGCDPRQPCINTVGSYYCDFCETGYIGTNKSGCYLDNFCISGAHDCNNVWADCIYLGPAEYRCVCKPGYAGNGERCGLDSDNDGHPDRGVSCVDWGCFRDNCMYVSNSNQEDSDGDNKGNNCDDDDDNDGRWDYLDNCQYVFNWDQLDTDGDGVGDVCDNCPNDVNADQIDTDADGIGDTCDSDDDGDGVVDGSDNCPLVANAGQENSGDSDTVGDACDNCVNVNNDNQLDTDQNGVGDACDTVGGINKDEDGDSILDIVDNCPAYPNADQSDIDSDGTGDLCDSDIDGDTVINGLDNCPYYSNVGQDDIDGNGVGDDCETDADGDTVIDKNDTCPHNPAISATSFSNYFTVDLDPSVSAGEPYWEVKDNGAEVQQTVHTWKPVMLIGEQAYGAVEYAGTWFTKYSSATDYFACVFGYTSNRKFYVVTWKGVHYNYGNSTYKAGIKGIQLKVVDSSTGPGTTMAEAIWHSYDTVGETKLIWQDPDLQGWLPETSYRWFITHQPSVGYINIKVYRGYTLMVDSGSIYDSSISGGRLGVLQFGDMSVIWSNLRAECLDHINQALHFDGIDDFVTLDDVFTLQINQSFTVEAWLKLDSGYTAGPYPIFCTSNGSLCLWVENSLIHGQYGSESVVSTTPLSADIWYNVIYRSSIEDGSLTIFIDGVQDGLTGSALMVNWTAEAETNDLTLYIGKQNDTFFKGSIDELRVYSVGVPDTDIVSHISLVTLQRPVYKDYGVLHFKMEESPGVSNLTNSGLLAATSTLSGGSFVSSYQQYNQFKLAYPNNRR
ncbi:uncharacterized protein LOC132716530 [Ruditapes philippinarum]|uniref:uncharacterized protein LOC132716530 n=1 Tax=Ruditapes philippinarum TaxID=129788 RepID=UPI00295B13C3|nr:uncharacterized protein LOC132716530 [Ruditapes philippinarum]